MYEKIMYMFVFNICALTLLIVINIAFQNDLMSRMDAISEQCSVDYTIEIPDIENINLKGK